MFATIKIKKLLYDVEKIFNIFVLFFLLYSFLLVFNVMITSLINATTHKKDKNNNLNKMYTYTCICVNNHCQDIRFSLQDYNNIITDQLLIIIINL